jgi:hypothetical protein
MTSLLPESYTTHVTQSCGGTEDSEEGKESIAQMHVTNTSQYDTPDTYFPKAAKNLHCSLL